MPVNSSSYSLSGFSVHFWQPYAPAGGTCDAAGTTDAAGTPRLSYSAQLHGTHADFCRGENFPRYKEEVRQNLAFLADFCRRHQMPDARDIEDDFNEFFRHRFDEEHYFDTRAEIVDSIGKQSLDEFCSIIRNDATDPEKRKTAIRNLSQGVTLCADGAVSNLVCAASLLAKSIGGIRGKLWALKAEIANNVLLKAVDDKFGRNENYLGNEIHYVNTVWNILADQFGLEKIPDAITMAEAKKDIGFLTTCAARLNGALTPDRLSCLIAETCHARFIGQIAIDSKQFSGEWSPSIEEKFAEKLEEIGNDFGLTSTDELELGGEEEASRLRGSDLHIRSFLKLEENDTCTYTYTFRTDPSLIALDVLRTMGNLKLLQAESCPQNEGEWIEENGLRAALFTYGELAWVARIPQEETFEKPIWNSKNVQFELITLPDLLQWEATWGNDGQVPPPVAIHQAIRGTAAEQLMQMPARWLEEAENVGHLLQRLGTDQAADYLATNLSYLGPIGAGYTNSERKELLAHMMRMGLGNAVRALAEEWFPDPLTRMDMIYVVLLREAIPALHEAMRQQDAKAAVRAWYQPLRESGLLIFVAPRLADLLNTRYFRAPILAYVLSNGHASAVEAFHVLIKDLLRDPTVRTHIKDELPGLLAATDWHDISALSNAMTDGHTAAVLAFYTGLKDLLTDRSLAVSIRSPLLEALPDLLVGKTDNSDSGLGYALQYRNIAVIKVFHTVLTDLLSDSNIAPHIQRALPDLLAAKTRQNASGLSRAMAEGSAAATKAFYALLKDPKITPHIQHALPSLLTVRDQYGQSGLSHALRNGHVTVIREFHALLKDLLSQSGIAPYIQPALSDVVTAENKDGTSGLSYAVMHGHNEAVSAFFTMLLDPAIHPHIDGNLPEFLSAEQLKQPPEVTIFNRMARS